MKRVFRRYWPLGLALCVFWAIGAGVLVSTLRRNAGHLGYATDDTYIHMAMAKNFATHGVWGVTRYGFSSSSSSPLWTLLLAFVYRIFGVNDASPLVLNAIFATLLLILADVLLRRRIPQTGGAYRLATLLALVVLTPLPVAVLVGMEHTLHALITTLFLFLAAKITSEGRLGSRFSTLSLLVLAPIMTATRYEGLFLILAACLLFALRRQYALSIGLGSLSLIPLLVYGFIAHSKGWFWIPGSILFKNPLIWSFPHFRAMAANLVSVAGNAAFRLELVMPVIMALVLFVAASRRGEQSGRVDQSTIFLFVAVSLMHLLFVRVGWFDRYETYIIAPGIIVLAIAAREYLPGGVRAMVATRSDLARTIALVILAGTLLLSYNNRVMLSRRLPLAITDVYEQQWQMGRFLKRFYTGQPVAVNDIGVVDYEADLKTLDLMGLGSVEVAHRRFSGPAFASWFPRVTESCGVKAAVVYRQDFPLDAPEAAHPWIRVGDWAIENNVVCGDTIVSFFAREQPDADSLIAHLREFAPQLPPTVRQTGTYVQ